MELEVLGWWLLSLGDIPVLDVCFNYLFDLLFLAASSIASGAQAPDVFGSFPQVRKKRGQVADQFLWNLSSSGHHTVFHAAVSSRMLFPNVKAYFDLDEKFL